MLLRNLTKHADPEDGRIGILLVVCSLIVVLVVLVSAAVTSLQLQRRQLYACADAIAVGAAGLLEGEGYFGSGSLLIERDSVQRRAEEVFTLLSDSTCRVGEETRFGEAQVEIVPMPTEAGSAGGLHSRVEVEVSAVAKLPLLPASLRLTSQPVILRVSSTADLH